MEVCGGQTIRSSATASTNCSTAQWNSSHGPGCPGVRHPLEMIDRALEIAGAGADVIFCSFGDMLRVPGSHQDLFGVRAAGDVRIVYSPLDATRIAADNPDRGSGVLRRRLRDHRAGQRDVGAARPAPRAEELLGADLARARAAGDDPILSSPTNRGCRVPGRRARLHGDGHWGYGPLVGQYGVPIVVTGFEPLDLLEGCGRWSSCSRTARPSCATPTPRAVSAAGNTVAQQALADVFTVTDRQWRGIGMIPRSGWTLSPRYAAFDAELKFGWATTGARSRPNATAARCCGGLLKPNQCPAFGKSCTPRTRWAPPWSPAKAPAPPTTSSGGWRRRPVSDPAGRSRPECRTRRTGLSLPLRETNPHRAGPRRRRHPVRGTHREPVPAGLRPVRWAGPRLPRCWPSVPARSR